MAASSYIDDIFVNEEIMPADEVKTRVESFSLTCKNPERQRHEALMLGLRL